MREILRCWKSQRSMSFGSSMSCHMGRRADRIRLPPGHPGPSCCAAEGPQTDQSTACTVPTAGRIVLDIASTTQWITAVVVGASEEIVLLFTEDVETDFTGDLHAGHVPFHLAAFLEGKRAIALWIEQADGLRAFQIEAAGCSVGKQAVSRILGTGDLARGLRAERVPLDVAAEGFEFTGQ